MRTAILFFLCGLCNITNAQSFQGYSDATVLGAGFSYNVQISIRPNGPTNNASHAGGFIVKLISVTVADSKGYYSQGKTNRYYSCSELGSFCKPNKFTDVFVGINYQCKNVGLEQVRFTKINEEKIVSFRLEPNAKCSFQLGKVSVSNTADQPIYRKRIYEIEYPPQNNAAIAATQQKNNTSFAGNPTRKNNSGSTEVEIGQQSSTDNSQQNNTTNRNLSSPTANNQSLSVLSDKVKVNGQYVQVFEQNGTYYVRNADGSQHRTTKQAYDQIYAASQKNNSSVGASTQTTVVLPTYIPLNNYDATGTYSNPLTYNNNSSGYSKTAATIGVASTVISVLGEMAEENRAEKQRIQQEKAEQEAQAEQVRYTRQLKIEARKAFISGIKDAKIPLSSSKIAADELYYFAYSVNEEALSTNNPTLNLCGVFPIAKYGDGTWPYTSGIKDELSLANKGKAVTIVGYYTSKSDAESAFSSFTRDIEYHGFTATPFIYKGKPKSVGSDDGAWGDNQKRTDKAQEATAVDFWGNPIKKDEKKPLTNTAKPKVDFWGNPIKKDEKKPLTNTAKPKVDFWGNPIKKDEKKPAIKKTIDKHY